VRVVAGLLARQEAGGTRYLAAQRPPGKDRGLLWEFPGGKVEPGEDDRAALARELREELGCQVAVGEHLAEVEHDYPDLVVTLALYRCAVAAGEPQALEAHALCWESAAGLTRLPFCEADVPFLARIAALDEGSG
jgi:8-oxo-dGTP diphosphatase